MIALVPVRVFDLEQASVLKNEFNAVLESGGFNAESQRFLWKASNFA
jgi:hypothetical protein